MGRKTTKTGLFVILILAFALVLGWANVSPAAAPDEWIEMGEEKLFNESIAGVLEGHSIFQDALAEHPDHPVINAYSAFTRLLDLALREDQTGLTHLFEQYGITRSGLFWDTLDLHPSTAGEGEIYFPVTAPTGESIRSFMAGTLLDTVESSIADLTKTIEAWSETDKYIFPKERFQSDLDIELDYGDALLARSMLQTFRFLLLFVTAYDLDVDLREFFAVGNTGFFHPGEFFERYPDLLRLLPTDAIPGADGPAMLSNAKAALIDAIDDYLAASQAILNDPGTEPGAEEMIELDQCDLQREEWVRDNLSRLKNALEQGTEFELMFDNEIWLVTDSATGADFTVGLWENRSEGDFWDGCDSIGCDGRVDCVVVSGGQISMRLVGPNGEITLEGTLNQSETQITGSYSGWVRGDEVSGTFTAQLLEEQSESEAVPFNLGPLFGSTSGPYDLRDFAPAFDCFGEPIHGTVGQGLPDGPDATLGGMIPGMTQEEWGLEGTDAAGEISISDAPQSMSIQDNTVSDWSGIAPVFTDSEGDGEQEGTDIRDLYLAKDADHLYVRMTLDSSPVESSPSEGEVSYHVHFREFGDLHSGSNGIQVHYDQHEEAWEVLVYDPRGFSVISESYGVQVVDKELEFQVPLSELGSLTGRYLSTWVYLGYGGPADYNKTCLQVGPLTSLTLNIDAPEHDGSGPIYVGVFRYDGTRETRRDNLIHRSVIYPDEFTPGMTYRIDGLPAEAEVFAALRWDHDYTGYVKPGDYAGRSETVTLASDGSTEAGVSIQTPYAKDEEGPPFFEWANVIEHHTPDGVYTAVAAAVRDPMGSVPHTIESLEVTGPGDFTYTFSRSDFLESHRVYYRELPGAPADGEYSFTAVNEQGEQARAHYHLTVGEAIPVPDTATFQASGDPLAPTLSWGGVSEYQGNLFYRARIYDAGLGSMVWTSGLSPDTSLTVPRETLSQEGDYIWRVEAFDRYSYIISNKRAVSESIPLNIDNSRPFFDSACVYAVPEAGGTWTALAVWVKHPSGSVPENIQEITVTRPDNSQITMVPDDYLEAWDMFWKTQEGLPATGIYRFEVTDTEGNKAVTYDYVDGSTVPVVDVGTMQATGGEGRPLVLSWAAPEGMDRPVYYRAIIEDGQGNRVWSSGMNTLTAVTVPQDAGLQPGTYYEWSVRVRDLSRWGHHNAESTSPKKSLALDNSSPYFQWAAAYVWEDRWGTSTAFDVSVYHPDGEVPGSIRSLKVEGPGGFELDILNDDSLHFSPEFSSFWVRGPDGLSPGVYTFTVEDQDGNTAVTRDWLGEAPVPPLVDPATIQVTGDPMAPTVSWEGVPGYNARPYYRVRVYDSEGNTLYRTGREPQTFQTLPDGIIQPGKVHLFRVETQDHYHWVTYNARSNSDRVLWVAPEHAAMPAISGRVTDRDGRPIKGLMVYAFDRRCGGEVAGWAWTDGDGEYHMGVRAEEVYIKTDARYNHLPYRDKWFDWSGGTVNCSHAARLTIPGTRDLTGIDFSLERLPKRAMFFEVVVGNGDLGGGFSVEPGYRDRLAKASMVLPNPARNGPYLFDLENDKFVWDSECRHLRAWWHQFGPVEDADYGEYTLVLEFKDGSQERAYWSLEPASVDAVDSDSIAVTVYENGDAFVDWDRPGGTNQYYQVRVRESDSGKEIYRSDTLYNAGHLFIPASDLGCLEQGDTYRWLVRAYDNVWPLYNRSETRETTASYAPADLQDRVTYWEVVAAEGDVMVVFLLRPASRDHITGAVVTHPNGSTSSFDLAEDRFDLSSETRPGMKGWYKRFDLTQDGYGEYRLAVTFEDGYTETLEGTLAQVPVLPVPEDSMNTQVNPDGSVRFSWALPADAGRQVYQVRVRSKDGSIEYYASPTMTDATEITAWPYDLRALEPGLVYRWHVRAYDEGRNTREQGQSKLFVYDPYSEGRVFDLSEAIRVFQALAGSPVERPFPGGDMDGDGRLDMPDAITILQHVGGLR